MNEPKQLHVVLVGAGPQCAAFIDALKENPLADLVGLVDPSADPESLRLSRENSFPVSLSLDDLGTQTRFDVVILVDGDGPTHRAAEGRLPEGVFLVHGAGLTLFRILAEGVREKTFYEGRFQHMKQEFDQYLDSSEQIIGSSSQIERMKELIKMVAPTPSPVLLLGETGVGKDLAARNIHLQSPLRGKPFVCVNCTALTSTLMESELFGYRKGAFTGAEQDRMGLLEEAHGGTLFLDEIGDMHMELQAKMLRFLQTGELRRVGDSKNRQVSVRLIAATNRPMEDAVEQGLFRRDLYYRFNTFTIHIPPLRERRKDIPYLAYHFLTVAEKKLNRRVSAISEESLALLAAYDWPGNIRELANVMERAVILSRGDVILPESMPLQLHEGGPRPDSQSGPEVPSGDQEGFCTNRERIMTNFEKRELVYYLKQAGGNVSEACRQSGIPRRTFYRKMHKYGL